MKIDETPINLDQDELVQAPHTNAALGRSNFFNKGCPGEVLGACPILGATRCAKDLVLLQRRMLLESCRKLYVDASLKLL